MSEFKTSQELRSNLLAAEYFLIPRQKAARLSLPVPALVDGQCVERFFLTDMTGVSPGDAFVPRPYAWLEADARTGDMRTYQRCTARDFLDPALYPADCRLSNQVGFADKATFQDALARLREQYEQLRALYWHDRLSGTEAAPPAQREAFRHLFQQCVRAGQLPVYQALSPDFFRWLGLGGVPAQPPAEEGLREALDRLAALFQSKIHTDAHKEKLFDNMHRELISFRNGAYNKPLISMALDVITMIDNIDKVYKGLCAKEDEGQRLKAAMAMLLDNRQELEDILYRASFEPYSCPGDAVDTRRQRIVAYEKTDDPAKLNRIAARLGEGYEFEGVIIRPERIRIYKGN